MNIIVSFPARQAANSAEIAQTAERFEGGVWILAIDVRETICGETT